MFPRAHTACSLMCWWGDVTRLTKAGIAPPSTTAAVWSEVPEAMLVRAHEASNWIGGQSVSPRKATNLGMSPALIIWSMGGCLSRDSSFLQPAQHMLVVISSDGTLDHTEVESTVTLRPVWLGAATQDCHCSLRWESPQLSTAGWPAKTGSREKQSSVKMVSHVKKTPDPPLKHSHVILVKKEQKQKPHTHIQNAQKQQPVSLKSDWTTGW